VVEYERHEPEKALLHQIVREQLEGFLASTAHREQPTPRFVEQELRAFLRCGVLAHGFLRVHCDACGHDRLVAFSCKRRGFCPSCGGRRMADTAAHMVHRVLPEVPIRQWVLTLPYPLRYRCAYDAKLTSEVLRAFVRSMFAELRRRACNRWGEHAEQCGAVTFIQRFAAGLRSACASHASRARGSAMNLNVHFHTLVVDGVYVYSHDHGRRARFLPLPAPQPDEVGRVLAGAARRIQRVIEARHADDEDALARDEPLLALLAAASLRTRIATDTHRGEPWRRLGDRVEPHDLAEAASDPEASDRAPQHGGMSLHAEVAVPAHDRRRLERLCRYVARPPLASERLEEHPDGRLALRLKTRWRDGTTHILMERRELIERLVPLIPPPRAHQVRYHGILAPSASMRDRIVPRQTSRLPDRASTESVPCCRPRATNGSQMRPDLSLPSDDKGHRPGGRSGDVPDTPTSRRERGPEPDGELRDPGIHERAGRMRWAALLQRVFEVDALRCPRCGSTMRLIAAIEDPDVARCILECLELAARAPPLGEATGGNDEPLRLQPDWLFDQSTGHDEP
jgi:hypothetical protein